MAVTERERFVLATLRAQRAIGLPNVESQSVHLGYQLGLDAAIRLIEDEAGHEVHEDLVAEDWHGVLDAAGAA